ncbi:hypothetical protein A2645_00455 [Candidatus Nomurabacteria bacterium RIFCSPHIGHO2_01_FULL_39_9]|uniref:Uncharacterized protein n=1 Tax=Candidatus Nomurabacteria bacterium RIFCSPHIGHO2_01_FULL_39_9 TaxID=1801735 RepID=A0A1F6UUY7_9BACT|nr:MAG: hypothetical protein A2645_00455 [Candidatus Nomurabacteria bacterium RIFCSPHIGHO2_01_FULL_39_9]
MSIMLAKYNLNVKTYAYSIALEIKFCYIDNMNVITIPKNLVKMGDLVVLPRKEYEALFSFKKIKEFKPTIAQKKALIKAELNLKKGKNFSYNELRTKLGFAN